MPVNNTSSNFKTFKVVLLGEGCVGKTSIVLRYVEDKFNPQHISTLQASFLTKKLTLEDGSRAHLNIWDTAGQERFHALGPIYYRGSHGAILVYDITDEDSFQKVKNWVKELKRMLGAEIVITIVGNKTDLEAQRTVEQNVAIEYADSVGAHYFETSAKANEGIEELFTALTQLMMQRHEQRREQENSSLRLLQGGRTSQRLVVEDDSQDGDEEGGQAPASNRSCCGAG
ncbi:ras-related protein Rab-21 [Ceratitis capitata]|uniref:Ras-related protein Rab-21 n=1 Tax=Ceratitis capitata TaxID=7213 RepID=W8BLZ9_CERCA|nr:ras-related protein Rab-21 [Ceratitis capitata]